MSSQHFSTGVRFYWRDHIYEIRRTLAASDAEGSKVIIEDIATEAAATVEMDTLKQALFAGELKFETVGKTGRSREAARDIASKAGDSDERNSGSNYITLDDCPPHLAEIARYRLEVIRPLVALPPSERTLLAIQARVREIHAQRSAATVESAAENAASHGATDIDVGAEEAQLSSGEGRDPNVQGVRDCAPGTLRTPKGSLSTSISVASLYRWMKDYTTAGNDIRALIPNTGKQGGKMETRLDAQVNNTIEATIRERYMARERVTAEDVLREVAVRIEEANRSRAAHDKLPLPSRRTIARRIDAFTMTQGLASYAAKHGKAAAKRAYTQYGVSTQPTMPLERVEIDHTRSDLIVVDDDNLPLGRLTLTFVLDVYTRYPLGLYLGFEPPSYFTVMEALFHAICPKRNVRAKYGTEHEWAAYGVPHVLVIDNGKEFVGRDLRDACDSLGIVLQQTPVRTPNFKGTIERQFGSLDSMLFHTLPGTTFGSTGKRGDYNSVKQACIGLGDIEQIIHIFFVDLYAERFHRGLRGVPARQWEEAIRYGFIPRVPASLEELQVLLGRVEHRSIHHYGIDFELIRYNCPDLARLRALLRGQPVKLKYHPGDLSHIWVYDPFEQRYVEVAALDQEYTQNLSLWKHRIIKKVAGQQEDRVDQAALGRARRHIQKVVDDARGRKRTSTQGRKARWDTAGKPIQALVSVDNCSQGHLGQAGAEGTEGHEVAEAMELIRVREIDLSEAVSQVCDTDDEVAPPDDNVLPVPPILPLSSSSTGEPPSISPPASIGPPAEDEDDDANEGWEIDYGALPSTRRE